VSLIYKPPRCPACHAAMLRWSWWEHPDETVVYWYCLDCDKRGHEPCIIAMPKHLQDVLAYRLDRTVMTEEDKIAISRLQPGRLLYLPRRPSCL